MFCICVAVMLAKQELNVKTETHKPFGLGEICSLNWTEFEIGLVSLGESQHDILIQI